MLHVEVGDEVLELSYVKNDLEILLNGKKMPIVSNERYHSGESIDYMVLPDDNKSYILVHLKALGLTVFYDSLKVKMVMPYNIGRTTYAGECKIRHKNQNSIILDLSQ